LFGNWLNGVAKKDKDHIRVGVCALLWAVWNVRNDFTFQMKLSIIFAGYSFGYPLYPYVVLFAAGGATPGYGYWVQPSGDGSTGFLQPVRLAY
jgi:hypothetical protein